MQNETSFDTYHRIKEDGTLSHTQLIVYEYLLHHPLSTDRDIEKGTGLKINQVTGRRCDLKDMGIVESCGTIYAENENGNRYPQTRWKIKDSIKAQDIRYKADRWRRSKAREKAKAIQAEHKAISQPLLTRWVTT